MNTKTKRIFLLLLCVSVITASIVLFTMCSNRSSGKIQLVYDYDKVEDCYVISGTNVRDDDEPIIAQELIIPSEYNKKPVKAIRGSAFSGLEAITSVSIPDSIEWIGSNAFYGCSGLTSVTIPDSVTEIGYAAFAYCNGLTSVTIGKGVTKINERAFEFCKGLTSIDIPDNVEYLGASAFCGCAFKNISIGKGITSIDISSLGNSVSVTDIRVSDENTAYKSIDGDLYSKDGKTLIIYAGGKTAASFAIPNGVTEISKNAFMDCTRLTEVTIPNSVKYIRRSAFMGCTGLTRVDLGNGVTNIEDCAFANCTGLSEITLPDSVTSIKTSAFYECTEFTDIGVSSGNTVYRSINGDLYSKDEKTLIRYACAKKDEEFVLPDNVTEINLGAFYGAYKLKSMTLPFIGAEKGGESNTHFGYIFGAESYSETTSVLSRHLESVTLTEGSVIVGNAFRNCSFIKSITLPDSLTKIEPYAFSNCRSLKEITIPSGVTAISESAFNNCSNLECINVSSDNTVYKSIDGILYSKDGKTLILYARGKKNEELVIPNSVTEINFGAFYGASKLKSLTVTFVGTEKGDEDNAYFGSIFGAQNYEENAEYVPASLKTVVVSGGSTVASKAFYGCAGLTSITISNSVTSIGSSAFTGCTGLTEMTLPFLGASKDGKNNSYFGYIFGAQKYESKDKYIPESLKTLVLTGGSTIISSAFHSCKGLTSITIPDSVTAISESAFSDCTNLEYINVSSGNTVYKSIDGNLYSKDEKTLLNHAPGKKDTDFVVPNSVTSIGNQAFYQCEKLTSITIPNSVTSIGHQAFYRCKKLASVTIPNNLASIGYQVFYQCEELTSITIPDSVTSIESQAFYQCKKLTSIMIPDSVTSIESQTFYQCEELTSITIGSGVTRIDDEAFLYSKKITEINVSAENTAYKSIDGNLYSKDEKTLVQYAVGKTDSSFVIPDSVTDIGAYAFYECGKLHSVTLPNDITRIGNCAFANFIGLTSITIPDSVTSIGWRAFETCNKLTHVTVPDSVTKIEDSAFHNCNRLCKHNASEGYNENRNERILRLPHA